MILILSAPSNLGLRPPTPGGTPGAGKAPEALRDAGLFRRLGERGAEDAGVVLAGRYVDDDATRSPDLVRNEAALVDHARRLADRLDALLDSGRAPLVLGGDCSVLIGIGLALARRGGTGLVHVDGHTDFRHPGNSDQCGSVAGEDLAAAVGLHRPAIADIDHRGPYFAPHRVVHIGHRTNDEEAFEARQTLGLVLSARDAARQGPASVGVAARAVAGSGYWLQVDVDVLDASVMPAVDSPEPGGLSTDELVGLLEQLAPKAVGASVTIFDPDLDPNGAYARLLTEAIETGLARLGTAAGRSAG